VTNFLKCPSCSAEFATARALADHNWTAHGTDETATAPVSTEPTVPYLLNENDRKLLKGLRIGAD